MSWFSSVKKTNAAVITAPFALAAVTAACAVLAISAPQKAEAFPAYAKKEKKECSYCHVKKDGGGKRTEAGEYYKTHKNSFAGYKPAGAKPAVKPTPKPAKPTPKPAKPTPKPAKPAPKKG
jgi:hypothetical protein